MSNAILPDYRFKQKLLYIDKTNPDTLKKYGDMFMGERFLSDALEFYQKAADRSSLEKVKETALSNGDSMLFQQAAKALGVDVTPAEWENIAERAGALKKYCFAMHALRKADNEAKLKLLREIMEKEVD